MAKAAVALSVLVLMSACDSHPVATSSVPSAPPGNVIPWTPLTPNLVPPVTLGPPPLPPGTLPCKAADLVATVIGSSGATGHVMTSFVFAGVGPGSCYVDGTPLVGLVDTNGQSIPFKQQAPYLPPLHPGPTVIQPGPLPTPHTALKVGQASLTIDWTSQPEFCPGSSGVLITQALIAIPSGGTLTVAIPPEPAAYACAGLGVGSFETPYVPVPPSPLPPLPAIAMQVPSSVRVGHALPYLVTLTADGSQPFDFTRTCPTYEEELFVDMVHGSPPLGGKHIYALNCGPAAVLKPGGSVTFQMVFLSVPADATPGNYTLVFSLGYWNAMTSYVQAPVAITR